MVLNIPQTDVEYARLVTGAGNKLVVLWFTAKWCGPCQRIAPVVEQMANQYVNCVFVKVDIDLLGDVATSRGVTSIPTFILQKQGQVLLNSKGADDISKIQKLLQDSQNEEDEGKFSFALPSGMTDLTPFIDANGTFCLNESSAHPRGSIFEANEKYLESDCDEQLLINVAFNQPVKLHSFAIQGPDDGRAPKVIKLYINETALDFDSLDGTPVVQEFDLEESQVIGTVDQGKGKGEASEGPKELIPLKFVKFQRVNSVTVFVESNQGEEETSAIKRLVFIGQPVQDTNMKDFKRVAGNAGESHH